MSGGHFDYEQYALTRIADSTAFVVENNHVKDDYGYCYGFSDATIAEFKIAIRKFREAAIYAQRIDWLISGDDGEESFHERLREDLAALILTPQPQ